MTLHFHRLPEDGVCVLKPVGVILIMNLIYGLNFIVFNWVHVFVNVLNIVTVFTVRLWNTFCENGPSVVVFFFRFCRYISKISLYRFFSPFSYLLINLHSTGVTMNCRIKQATTSQAKKKKKSCGTQSEFICRPSCIPSPSFHHSYRNRWRH